MATITYADAMKKIRKAMGKAEKTGTLDDLKAAQTILQKIIAGREKYENQPVTTICYGEVVNWKTRREALDFFEEGMTQSDGSEQGRYTRIYTALYAGATFAEDKE